MRKRIDDLMIGTLDDSEEAEPRRDGMEKRDRANRKSQNARAEIKINVLLLEFQFGTENLHF